MDFRPQPPTSEVATLRLKEEKIKAVTLADVCPSFIHSTNIWTAYYGLWIRNQGQRGQSPALQELTARRRGCHMPWNVIPMPPKSIHVPKLPALSLKHLHEP